MCEVSIAYLTAIHPEVKRLEDLLYPDALTIFGDLLQRARLASNDGDIQRMRAFFCIECLQSEALKHLRPSMTGIDREPMATMYPRSWKGLTDRIGAIKTTLESFEVNDLHIKIKSKDAKGVDLMHPYDKDRARSYMLSCYEACGVLRSQLKQDTTHLGRVGELWGNHVPTSSMLLIGNAILSVNMNNALSPWNETIESQD